eukprot:TRINITY_DN3672_c0_g1_i1.p1 TRINITY_DN3672_c0_g1~~TRINITY_DN3672_c0_g1_i1.p1  ORF type:complete len:521 (-),score=254.01 TRINITY_DN3672_c0_g1_i1:40-1602(-)
MEDKIFKMDEVSEHNKQEDCWVVIHGKVFNVTNFLDEHPGGSKVIMQYAGKDGTPGFEPFHNTDVLELLPPSARLGKIDPSTLPKESAEDKKKRIDEEEKKKREEEEKSQKPTANWINQLPNNNQPAIPFVKPPIEQMLNIMDFEFVARQMMKKEGWGYYSSGGDDEITLRENRSAFQRIWLKPRVMVDVSEIDMKTTMLGTPVSIPLYITATALGKLADPEGEVVLTRAARAENIVQMCPTLASNSLDEMLAARHPDQTQWYQLYVNKNRELSEKIVKRAEAGGMTALFVTVDAPQLGRREKDMRNKFEASAPDVQKKKGEEVNRNKGTARAISTFIDPSLSWKDMKWINGMTKMAIVLKGVQTGEDAILAYQHGAKGIVLSNHGGRQLDTARSGIEILPEVTEALRRVGAEGKMEIFVDGGIRRGSDIFKAIALGATGVGIGRPALYAMAAYGQAGVERAIQLLKEELEMCMRLMGTPTIKDIKRDMVAIDSLHLHFVPSPKDYLMSKIYEPMSLAKL